MLEEGQYLASLAKNVTIKVPLTINGLKTCKALRAQGTQVNVTLCFSAAQALLAAKQVPRLFLHLLVVLMISVKKVWI